MRVQPKIPIYRFNLSPNRVRCGRYAPGYPLTTVTRACFKRLSLAPMCLVLLVLLPLAELRAAAVSGPQTNGSSDEKFRAKVGLVLSGGGARGAAHVGVLKVLEALQVPVDYIVGTSLGSVVGALYSLGQSPYELDSVLSSIDWNRGFVDDLPRARLPMRRKDEEDQFQINFELGIQNGAVTLPTGVIQGHSLHLLLKSLIGGAALTRDFDDLPIPFRAIATDIEASQTVVLGTGDLAKALQASMAIPAIYSPVAIEGKLLVDGGVTNNLAIDVVREMGADIVIAVDISTPLAERGRLDSVLRIVDQLTNVLTRANVEQQIASLGDRDIYIQPELDGYTSTDFGFVKEIASKGEQAAQQLEPLLRVLSLNDKHYRSYKQHLKQQPLDPLPSRVSSINLSQNSGLSDELLLKRTRLGELSEYSMAQLHGAIDEIYSTDLYERVDYRLDKSLTQAQAADIHIDAVRKSWGADTIRFGFRLEDDFEGDNNFNLSLGYTRRAINRLGGDLRLIGQIGETPRLLIEFFQPFDARGGFFSLLRLEHQQFSRGTFVGGSQTGEFRLRRNQLSVFAGWQNRNNIDIRAGLITGNGLVRRIIGDDSLEDEDGFRDGLLQLRLRHDTLDNVAFPSRGKRLRLVYERAFDALNADREYDAVTIDGLFALRRGRTRWLVSSRLASAIEGVLPAQRAFGQGSVLSTAGLRRNAEVGQHAGRFSLLAYRPLTAERVQALEYPVFLGASLETGRVFQQNEELDWREVQFTGNVFIAADTPAGPLYFGVGGEQGEGISALLSLGLTF